MTTVISYWYQLCDALRRDDEGQTMAEYGLILAGIAIIVMATVFLLGGAINTTFTNILNQLNPPAVP